MIRRLIAPTSRNTREERGGRSSTILPCFRENSVLVCLSAAALLLLALCLANCVGEGGLVDS